MTDGWGKRVPAEGPLDAKIMIVGESPGKNESEQGRPFVGRSGVWFDEILKKIGLDRKDLYITNANKYKPRGRKDAKRDWFFGPNGQPTPQFAEGIEELREDIERIKPNVIVPLGNYALWALTGYDKITKYRGSILPCTLVEGRKVVPAIHPSYFIRGNIAEHPLLVWDLTRAKEESDDPALNLPERNYTINPSAADISMAVQRLLDSESPITIDTEWFDPEHLSCIGFTNDPSWAICIPYNSPGAFDAYRALLGSPHTKIFQNAMFDCTYLERAGLPVRCVGDNGERLIEDIMVGHYVTWQAIRKGLDTTTSIYTREPYYKDDYKVATEGATYDLDTYYTYNCKDVVVTHEIWLALQQEFEDWGTRKAYEFNMLTFDIMKRATLKGLKADREKLKEAMAFYRDRAETMQAHMNKLLGTEINMRSPTQVASLVYDALKVKERAKRTVNQETLMDIAAQTDDLVTRELLKMIILIRRDRNAISKYLNEKLVDTDGRIRSSWNMAGTENGRLSATKDNFKNRGVSLQTLPVKTPNMPYTPRDVCVADEGHIFIKPDLSQAEARVVAFLAEDWKTIDWMEDNLDIHKKLAEALFNVPYEEVGKESRERYLAKKCRHALNYIMGPRTFKLTINKEFIDTGFGVTESEARRLKDRYLTIHAPLEMWWKEVTATLNRNGMWLENPLGRRRTFTEAWGHKLHKEAVAFVPQSTIADLTHMGLDRIAKHMPWADILVNMHDGSIIQIPEDRLDEAAEQMIELLTIPIIVKGKELVVPVDIEWGHSWGDMKPWKG